MTKHREFKALVRERMAKTGERYTAARAQILTQLNTHRPAPPVAGLIAGYDRFGGIQSGTGALVNVLRHAGVTSALTRQPYTEAALDGLCGGPGFLYAVFEYKGWPPMLTLALRSRSMPDVYIAQGLARVGVKMTRSETTSAAVARKALDTALNDGRPALCVTDIASLPWSGLPKEFVGGGPHVVAVAGQDGDSYWIDDRRASPIRIDAAALARARAAYRHAKQRLITIDTVDPKHDAKRALRTAILDTAHLYINPAVPKAFQGNCGFAGLEKWRTLLTDSKDKKGWPVVFSDGARAFSGLQRLYECIECQSAPHAGRALYADFLKESSTALSAPTLTKAAAVYRESGSLWAQIAALVAECADAAVRKGCEMADHRIEAGDESSDGAAPGDSMEARQRLASECRLSKESALGLYQKIATLVGQIADAERAAVDLLNASKIERAGPPQ
jgi:hypothetical protein